MIFNIYVEELGAYNRRECKGGWIDMLNHKDWDTEFKRIGVNPNEELFISDYDSTIRGVFSAFGEYAPLNMIDDFVQEIKKLSSKQLRELNHTTVKNTGNALKSLELIKVKYSNM